MVTGMMMLKEVELEGDDCRGRGDVVIGCELGDAVCDGDAHETKVVWIGEKSKDIFVVELAAVKRACDVHSTLHLNQHVRTGRGSLGAEQEIHFRQRRSHPWR